jgi:two-component sensor histidine kinase/CheY-like chemotaxis protein
VSPQLEQPINILIVDDEPKNLAVLETVLEDSGYRLVRAASADQALLALVVDEFALIILDIRMPGMTGLELAQTIKERKKTAQVPILFLTAYYNEDEHVLAGYGTGAVDYIQKPVNPAILRSKVAVFAELYRRNRENALANRALLSEVTERRRAEEKLRELNGALEQRVTERTEALQVLLHEKEVLLKEIHHRVKNNLQIVSSLLNLQSRQLVDAAQIQLLSSTIDRVRAMASIHEQLYQSGDFVQIDLSTHLKTLVQMLTRAHLYSKAKVLTTLRCDKAMVDLNIAVPLSLIANELIVNALKYAFVGDRPGSLVVGLTTAENHHELSIADDGPGFGPDIDPTTNRTLGLRLVRDLTQQIRGELQFCHAPSGVKIVVRWPVRQALSGMRAQLTTA